MVVFLTCVSVLCIVGVIVIITLSTLGYLD